MDERLKAIWRRIKIKMKIYNIFKKARDVVNKNYSPTYKKLINILLNPYRSEENAKFIMDYVKHMQFFQKFL